MIARTPPAILLGGEAAAIAVGRSLGRAGIGVIGIGDAASSPLRHSRFCVRFEHVAPGTLQQRGWLDVLARLPPGVVLPCTDEGVELIARRRAELEAYGHLVIEADDHVALAMLDKEATYELARAAGVEVPRTRTVGGPDDVDAIEAEIGYPVGLKPLHVIEFRRHYGLSRKLFLANNRRELEEAVRDTSERGLQMQATEIIPGKDDRMFEYIAYMDANGDPIFEFTTRKLRQYPPDFGNASYIVSRHEPELARIGREFFRSVGLRGLAAIEFKRDDAGARWVLIECNHRFPNFEELLVASGIQAGVIAYRRLLGQEAPPSNGFREGVRLLFLIEDARGFLIRRRRGELTTARWLASLLHRQRFPVFRWDDPAPSAALLRARVARRLRR
jgi:D-aspartate ligase